jgi:hypothetical protein
MAVLANPSHTASVPDMVVGRPAPAQPWVLLPAAPRSAVYRAPAPSESESSCQALVLSQGSGSDPGPASMGLIIMIGSESSSVRLVLATLGSAPAPAQSGLIAQSWVLFKFRSEPQRHGMEHPLSPTRRHPVQLSQLLLRPSLALNAQS